MDYRLHILVGDGISPYIPVPQPWQRLHSALGCKSPDQFEMEVAFPCKSRITISIDTDFHLPRVSLRPEAHESLNTVV